MDWETIIAAVAGAVAAGGGIGGIVYFRENKRAKKIENDKAAAEEWKELYKQAQSDLKEKEEKIDTMGLKLDKVFDEMHKKEAEFAGVVVQLTRSRFLECIKTPCTHRDPPWGAGSLPELDNIKLLNIDAK